MLLRAGTRAPDTGRAGRSGPWPVRSSEVAGGAGGEGDARWDGSGAAARCRGPCGRPPQASMGAPQYEPSCRVRLRCRCGNGRIPRSSGPRRRRRGGTEHPGAGPGRPPRPERAVVPAGGRPRQRQHPPGDRGGLAVRRPRPVQRQPAPGDRPRPEVAGRSPLPPDDAAEHHRVLRAVVRHLCEEHRAARGRRRRAEPAAPTAVSGCVHDAQLPAGGQHRRPGAPRRGAGHLAALLVQRVQPVAHLPGGGDVPRAERPPAERLRRRLRRPWRRGVRSHRERRQARQRE